MAKILSAEEARLQKKLIPLNIFVFILSLVAALSLVIMPFLKIDVGKILREENVINYADETLEKLIDDNLEVSTEEGFRLNFSPIVAAAVVEVFGNAEGTISFSTLQFCRYAADKREDKLEILFDGIVYGEKGFVTELVNSLVEGVANTFTSERGKAAVENAVVDSLISSMGSIVDSAAGEQGSEIASVIKEKITEEKASELKETLLSINNAKSEEDVVNVIGTFVDKLNDTLGDEYNITQENKEVVTDYFVNVYNETVSEIQASGAENQQFSLEAMICVTISKNVNLDGININKLLQDYADRLNNPQQEEEPSPALKALTEGEEGEETETGEESGEGEGGGESETPVSPPPAEGKVLLTYSELFSGMGLDPDQLEEISDNINKIVRSLLDNNLAGLNNTLKETGWAYQWFYVLVVAGLALFILPWIILALAAFIRTFTKNKRYSMWYVKLFGFIPALIFVGLFVLKKWGTTLIFKDMAEDKLGLITSALGGISSFTWICGICYILLWLVSIFWAFPIKHKIRKERKSCKKAGNGAYNYNGYNSPYGYPPAQDPGYLGGGSYYDYDYDDDGLDSDYDYDYDYDDYDYDDDDDDY